MQRARDLDDECIVGDAWDEPLHNSGTGTTLECRGHEVMAITLIREREEALSGLDRP